jgi:UrcA family protein
MSHLFKSMIAAALVFAAAGAPAAAQPWAETRSVRVAYDDLDMSSPAGAKTLLLRMKAATVKVCGRAPWNMLIKETMRHKACVDGAMSRAVMEANIPQVTALFAGSFAGGLVAPTAVR